MSSDALKWAKRQQAGGTGPKGLLLLLADYADSEHSCYPGQARLAGELECSERSVREWLAILEGRHLVRRRARMRRNGRGRSSDRYILAVDAPAAEGATAGRDTGKERRSNRQDPPEDPPSTNRQDLPEAPDGPTGTSRTTNRNLTHDQPAAAAREYLENPQKRDLLQADLPLPARAANAEVEDGGEALRLIVRQAEARLGAGCLAHVWSPTDTGGRFVLERRLVELLAAGWPVYDLVDELAGTLQPGVHSPVAVLLTRARDLGAVPPDVAHRADATDELRSQRLERVRRHARILAAACSTHRELLDELCATYGDDGDALEAAFAAADLDELGRPRQHVGAVT